MIATPKTINNCMTRRRIKNEIADVLKHVAKGYKSARRETPKGTWSKHFAKASQELAGIWGGSKLPLAPVIAALDAGDWAKAQRAMKASCKAWCKWAEGQENNWASKDGWASQKASLLKLVDMKGWKPYEPKAEEEPQEEPTKAKKTSRKRGKAAPKQEPVQAETPQLADVLARLADGQDKLASIMGDVSSKLDKVADSVVS